MKRTSAKTSTLPMKNSAQFPAQINIRVEPEIKEAHRKLQYLYGVDVAELLRDKVRSVILEALETVGTDS